MSTEIVLASAEEFGQKMEWCKAMSTGDMLPQQFRGKPANLLFAVEFADALNLPRIHALTSITVINGRPSPSSDLMATLARKAGHRLRVTGDDTHATATLIRADDPDFEYIAKWDVEKATKAQLWGNKGPWTNYPGAMLRSRAVSEVVRMGAPDCLAGGVYTPDEVPEFAPVRVESERVTAAEVLADAQTHSAGAQLDPASEAKIPATTAQQRRIDTLLVKAGVKERADKLAYLSEQFDRNIKSAKDLTTGEARDLIAYLEMDEDDLDKPDAPAADVAGTEGAEVEQ